MAAVRTGGAAQLRGGLGVGSGGLAVRAFPRSRLLEWSILLAGLAALLGVGLVGVYRYVDNFWLYRGYAPPRDPAWVRARGTAQTISVWSPAVHRSQQVIVYLPPGYSAHPRRRYPVFYLLHGSPGVPNALLQTVNAGVVEDELVARHKVRRLILVMPSGSTSRFTDTEWANGIRSNSGWETFLARDVVRAIDARYRTIRSGAGRALAGLSEGGYGALNIGFHHPREFRVIESWSGYVRADPVLSIFGRTKRRLTYNSPGHFVTRVARTLRRRHAFIWFYSGRADPFLRQNSAFARELARLHVRHRFLVFAGGHTWRAWRENFPAALVAASRGLSRG
ncbi:MAG TPA: alpha/beta hydrolase-fold protein [Gaiellaceae bacterium]